MGDKEIVRDIVHKTWLPFVALILLVAMDVGLSYRASSTANVVKNKELIEQNQLRLERIESQLLSVQKTLDERKPVFEKWQREGENK